MFLQQEGADFLFERVLAKPGSPTACSVLQGTLVVSLSGNPFAAAVHMELSCKICGSMSFWDVRTCFQKKSRGS